MADERRTAFWRRPVAKGIGAITLAVTVAGVAAAPMTVAAAETPAKIREAERNDPAAGEVVIINRKKDAARKSAAKPSAARQTKQGKTPDPFAPRPGKAAAATAEKPTRQNETRENEARVAPRHTGSPAARSGTQDRHDRLPDLAGPPPPLPEVNRDPRRRRVARTENDAAATPRSPPPTAWRNNDDGREAGRRRGRDVERDDARADERFGERWREAPAARRWAPPRSRRRFAGDRDATSYGRLQRPWQVCRRLAWRCQDGFERACWQWRRRCLVDR